MLCLRREAPARRAPQPSPAAVTVASQPRWCSFLEEKHTGSTSTTASNSSSRPHQPTPMLSSKRSTSSTSATAFTSSGHRRQLPPMLASRGEAPAQRAPLHPTATVTTANQRRCFASEGKRQLDERHCLHQQRSPSSTTTDACLSEEKHRLDEHHCIHQQQSPSPTNVDALLSRRRTSSTSATACTRSSHPLQTTPMLCLRREALARRAPLHRPAAVTVTNQRRCFPL
jgi:hypothetical protein